MPITTMAAIKVNKAFASLIPTLNDDERQKLEASLMRHGCLCPLIVWKDKGILLDGHHRYAMCAARSIDYEVREIDLEDETDAKLWILDHQFGRRNLQPYQRAELALQYEEIIAARAKARQGARTDLGPNIVPMLAPSRTRDEVAQKAGLSHGTIAKAKVISDEADEEVKEELRKGKTTINKEYKALRPGKGPAKQVMSREEYEAGGDAEDADHPAKIKSLGTGIRYAHEAINALKKIPLNDKLRKDGFRMVSSWIEHNA